MRARVVLILIALGLTMAVAVAPVSAGGLGTLDQQQTISNNAHAVRGPAGSGFETAQVFTAGISGQLDHVDLLLSTGFGGGPPPGGSGPGADLTVEIWTATAGGPASPVPGASATVLTTDVPQGLPIWVQVPISAPSVAGTQYAIVLSAPASTAVCPDDCWQWLFDDGGNPYAGGDFYRSFDGGANWELFGQITPSPDSDAAFRTYVTALAPATPTPAASLADAATALPATGSPLATVGFGLLLIGALGALLMANVRGTVRRQ